MFSVQVGSLLEPSLRRHLTRTETMVPVQVGSPFGLKGRRELQSKLKPKPQFRFWFRFGFLLLRPKGKTT